MESTVNKRIRSIIEFLGLSETRFSKEIGITQSVINSMFNKGTEPSVKTITAVLNTYTSISAEWLMRGKGEMFLQSEDCNMENVQFLKEKIIRLEAENKVLREVAGLGNAEADRNKEKIA